jgi:threonine dehydratase
MSLTLNDIQEALTRVHHHIKPTELIRCVDLEKELHFQGKIFLKPEYQQPTGSFKVRGAFNVLTQLSPEQRNKGVVTRSSGNFAQAVAFAAHKLQVKATIVMPGNAPKIKIEGTKKYHPTVIMSGNTHAESQQIVDDLVKEQGLTPLHPYNDYRTMAGQGTAALEILQQLSEIDHFYCPIGGGGLMGGCATALKESKRSIKTHGVEPAGAADYYNSRQTGNLMILEKPNTIADGLRAPSVGALNYPILNKYVDDVSTVSDDEIKQAMKWLYKNMQIVTEPSGAAAFAGFLKNNQKISNNVIILVSGKNVDEDSFISWISE